MGSDGYLLEWGELLHPEDPVQSVGIVVDGAVVKEPHCFVGSRDNDDGFEVVICCMFLECVDTS
jgi:hypothetical protein